MSELAEYLTPEESAEFVKEMAGDLGISEFAVVRNLDYVFSPSEVYPLAPRVTGGLDRIVAFAVDMDGTSTTTEPLALHALEYMVRCFTGKMTECEWPGLDPKKDYPYVIGNSNFRHTEFLVRRYGADLNHEALRRAFFKSMLWTLANMEDRQRRKDVRLNATMCGVGAVLQDPRDRAHPQIRNMMNSRDEMTHPIARQDCECQIPSNTISSRLSRPALRAER